MTFCTSIWADKEADLFPESWKMDVERIFGSNDEFVRVVRDLDASTIENAEFKGFIQTIRELSFDLSGLTRFSEAEGRELIESRFGKNGVVSAYSETGKAVETILLSELIDSVLEVGPRHLGGSVVELPMSNSTQNSDVLLPGSGSADQSQLAALWKHVGRLSSNGQERLQGFPYTYLDLGAGRGFFSTLVGLDLRRNSIAVEASLNHAERLRVRTMTIMRRVYSEFYRVYYDDHIPPEKRISVWEALRSRLGEKGEFGDPSQAGQGFPVPRIEEVAGTPYDPLCGLRLCLGYVGETTTLAGIKARSISFHILFSLSRNGASKSTIPVDASEGHGLETTAASSVSPTSGADATAGVTGQKHGDVLAGIVDSISHAKGCSVQGRRAATISDFEPGGEGPECGDANTGFVIVGLHSCGDLSVAALRLLRDPEAKAVFTVPCCYPKLSTSCFPLSRSGCSVIQSVFCATSLPSLGLNPSSCFRDNKNVPAQFLTYALVDTCVSFAKAQEMLPDFTLRAVFELCRRGLYSTQNKRITKRYPELLRLLSTASSHEAFAQSFDADPVHAVMVEWITRNLLDECSEHPAFYGVAAQALGWECPTESGPSTSPTDPMHDDQFLRARLKEYVSGALHSISSSLWVMKAHIILRHVVGQAFETFILMDRIRWLYESYRGASDEPSHSPRESSGCQSIGQGYSEKRSVLCFGVLPCMHKVSPRGYCIYAVKR